MPDPQAYDQPLGAEALGHPLRTNPQTQVNPPSKEVARTQEVTILSKKHPTEVHHVNAWYGKKDVRVVEHPKPVITDPQDVVVRVTSTAICGSDLHLYVGAMVGMEKGDVLGHEFMGVIESVGPQVTKHKLGDRVVVCFDISCGHCYYCNKQLYSSCDSTNCSKDEEAMYGHRTGGFFGYSHMTGGWEGGQAEFVRVPFADVNLLQVPAGVPDNVVILLSDVLPTAWHANELGEVGKGDVVAIWGAGPVGILSAHCAFHRGASRVIMIDEYDYRLEFAKAKVPGTEVINFGKDKVLPKLKELTGQGPDVCIDAVGFHYTKNLLHKIEMMAMLETDPSTVVNECIMAVRKGGRVSLIGAYAGYTNHFNIGAFMEKQLTMRGGQTPCQKYWHDLLAKVQSGALDPTMVITHELPLEQAPHGYQIFNNKEDGCIKVVLKPGTGATPSGAQKASAAAIPAQH